VRLCDRSAYNIVKLLKSELPLQRPAMARQRCPGWRLNLPWVPTKSVFLARETGLKRIAATNDLGSTTGFDHGGIHPQLNLPPISQELLAANAQGRSRPSAEVTEYVIKEIGLHQWLVLADRQSIALCAGENEAVKVMTEHPRQSIGHFLCG